MANVLTMAKIQSKARTFASLEAQNRFLADWERTVADTRIHGTTKRQVGKVFHEVERAALQPLPSERFPFFHEARRKVNRDGHVEVAKAYYSAPTEYLGREVWARWDARLVHLFNHRWEQIAVHLRHEQGRFSTHAAHIAREKIDGLEKGAAYLLNKVGAIGERTQQWAEAMVTARGIAGTRVLQGLLALTRKHSSDALEKACEIALAHGCWQLRTIRRLVGRTAEKQEPLPFLDEHPLIRPLDDYAAVVARASARALILDRFLHHAEVIPISGRSYRLRNQPRNEAPSPAIDDATSSKPAIPPTGSTPHNKRKKNAPIAEEACSQ